MIKRHYFFFHKMLQFTPIARGGLSFESSAPFCVDEQCVLGKAVANAMQHFYGLDFRSSHEVEYLVNQIKFAHWSHLNSLPKMEVVSLEVEDSSGMIEGRFMFHVGVFSS